MQDWRLNNTFPSESGLVRWDRFGDPVRDPVVLLHGTPFSSSIWRAVARSLAPYHCVYVWDMPGYGSSEKSPGQDLSLAALARVFAGLLDHWELGEPRVAAHDSGAAVALGAHLLHGVPYNRLLLVDAVALGPWGSPFFQVAGEYAEVFERLPPTLHRVIVRAYVDTASGPGLRPATLDALAEPWLDDDGQRAFYHQLAQRRGDERYTDELRPRYGTIDIPVMICWGEDDTWIPVERGRELASLVPGARFRGIPRAGHLVPEDSPAELTAALLAFLHELP
ncbi:MAG: alpha/beta fold hydrolase [Streptosporangiales bacterium]|nr:alpha/beta fold hydrolase [Streptosporangiales bacterium]